MLWDHSFIALIGRMNLRTPWKAAWNRIQLALIAKLVSSTNMVSRIIMLRPLCHLIGRKIDLIFRDWNTLIRKSQPRGERNQFSTGLLLLNKIRMKLIIWWGRHIASNLINMTRTFHLHLLPCVSPRPLWKHKAKKKVLNTSILWLSISFKTLMREIWRRSKHLRRRIRNWSIKISWCGLRSSKWPV